jgi:RHS repeat-associated protein
MVAAAPSAPSSPAGPSAQGRGASRIASDPRGATWVAPENAASEHLARRAEHAAAARCIDRPRPHRRNSHRARRRFSGQTRTGRYSWARYYHPQLQRFISEDPIGFDGGDLNLYAYVRNRPLAATDPLGLGAPWFHRQMTRDAARSCGMSDADADARGCDEGPRLHVLRAAPVLFDAEPVECKTRNAWVRLGSLRRRKARCSPGGSQPWRGHRRTCPGPARASGRIRSWPGGSRDVGARPQSHRSWSGSRRPISRGE